MSRWSFLACGAWIGLALSSAALVAAGAHPRFAYVVMVACVVAAWQVHRIVAARATAEPTTDREE